ncbi:MAG TPA: SRPBCC domain-containing protein [Gemmatimonadales bacterium]
MKEIRTIADIHATPDHVWQVLSDLAGYKDWNPYITLAAGGLEVGETLTLRLEPPGSSALSVRSVVLEADEPRELRWLWMKGFSGVCDSEECFVIVPKGDNRTHVIHRLTCTGLALSLPGFASATGARLETNFREGMEAMNRALKSRVQGGTGPGL